MLRKKGKFTLLIFFLMLMILLTLFSVNKFNILNIKTKGLLSGDTDGITDTRLDNISIKYFEGDLNFDPDTYSYNLNVYTSLRSLEITAISKDSDAVVTFDGASYLAGTTGVITLTVSNGIENNSIYTINYTRNLSDVVTNFSPVQTGQEYAIKNTGLYKLEVWGAAGGYRNTSSYGFGGYAVGYYNGVYGNKLYVYTGYQGSGYKSGSTSSPGGWNGGGTGGYGNQGGSGGGGASHITLNTNRGVLKNYNSYRSEVLIVAGGGGGGADDARYNGSSQNNSGGGYVGNRGGYSSSWPQYHATGGSQTGGGNDNAEPGTAGSFGQGSNYTKSQYGGNGGGGGWYGGGGSSRAHSGGGGGSGYIGNSLLIDDTARGKIKHMACYYCYTSTTASTYTISTSTSNSTATADTPKLGNGAARITRLAPLSNDNFLSSITTDKGDWNVSFKPDVMNYKITADMYDDSITINVTKSSNTSVMVGESGTYNLNLGYNYFTYTLTAEDGSVRTYNLTVIRGSLKGKHTSELYKITSLTNGDLIYVKKNIYQYNIPLVKGQVALEFFVEPYDPEATYKVYDNDLIGDGDLIKIEVEAPGCAKSIYLLTVKQQDKSSYNYTDGFTNQSATWTAPFDGFYQVEVWGAQGGTNNGGVGGYGGYAVGTFAAHQNQVFYYTVGGIGQPCNSGWCSTSGGYNGGGNAFFASSNGQRVSGGGGATHFAKELRGTGTLKEYTNFKSDILIVAGGGGGGGTTTDGYSYASPGGAGGGYQGQTPYSTYSSYVYYYSGSGGTQTDGGITYYNGGSVSTAAKGSFGQGGERNGVVECCGNSGGGGGYYGGGASSRGHNGGGGGSGFINSESLSDKHMYCYNCGTVQSETEVKTTVGSCYNATATADCSKTGTGAIRITRVIKSNNYYLRQITTDVGEWDNTYNPRNNEYTITVDPYTDFITFFGTKYQDEQEVTGLGIKELEIGDNYHTITVTAVSGDTRTYTFNVVREGISPSSLLYKIVIDGQTIKMENDVYEYDVDVSANKYSFDVKGYPFDKDANITYSGFGYVKQNKTCYVIVKRSGANPEQTVYTLNLKKGDIVSEVDFNYTGTIQSYKAPATGYYRLEVWGAQGGVSNASVSRNYGGYSSGLVFLEGGDIVYVVVGGQGSAFANGNNVSPGGYNGGGTGGRGNQGGSGGGGATHIAKSTGLLKNLSNSRDDILIVAGGGGGSSGEAVYYKGAGGGYRGNDGGYTTRWPQYFAIGAYQDRGANDYAEGGPLSTFGQGGNWFTQYGGNAGGGGYYGGGGASRSHSGGGGGSGYIGNELLESLGDYTKHMTCYSCRTTNETSMLTKSTTKVSSTAVSDYAKSGHGAARITYINFSNDNYLKILLGTDVTDKNNHEVLLNEESTVDFINENITLNVASSVTQFRIESKPNDSTASIEGNGVYTIYPGDNPITLKVTAENREIRTYTINVKRAADTNIYPENIDINGLVQSICKVDDSYCKLTDGTNNITFDKNTNTYYMTVPSRIKQIKYVVQKGHEFQKVTGDGVVNLTQSDTGITSTTIDVMSEHCVVNELTSSDCYSHYTFEITRDTASDTDIKNMFVDNKDTTHEFTVLEADKQYTIDFNYSNPDVYDYYFSVPNSWTYLKYLYIEKDDSKQEITINGNSEGTFETAGRTYLVTIQVLAPNKVDTAIYRLHVYRELNDNIFLSKMDYYDSDSIKYDLNHEFVKSLFEYNLNIPFEISSLRIDIAPDASTTNYAIALNGNPVSGTIINGIKTGDNVITISTTSQLGSTGLYTIYLFRAYNDDSNLLGIDVSTNEISWGIDSEIFNKDNFEYSLEVDEGISNVIITPTLSDTTTGIYKLLDSNNIVVGENIKRILVTAEDGTYKIYTLKITRPASSDNRLNSLTVTGSDSNVYGITLEDEVYDYEIDVPNEVKYVNIDGVKSSQLASTTGFGKYFLNTGSNSVIVGVLSESGESLSYNITINRAYNSDATIATLTSNEGTITPTFNGNDTTNYDYEISVPSTVKNINLTYSPTFSTTSVIAKDLSDNILTSKLYNNTYTLPLILVTGDNKVKLITLAEDNKTTLTYNVNIKKAASNDTSLKTLRIKETGIKNNDGKYSANLIYNIDLIHMIIEPNDPTASYSISASDILTINNLNDTVSGMHNDTDERLKYVVTVTVTAEDGTVDSYPIDLNVYYRGGCNTYLSSIKVDKGTLTPKYNKDINYYTVEVENDVLEINVSATAEEPGDIDPIIGLGKYSLNVGTTEINLTANAIDGETSREYQIDVLRKPSSDATLKQLTIEGASLDPAFNKNTFNYDVSVDTTYIPFSSITTTHPNATYEIINNELGTITSTGETADILIKVTAEDQTTTNIYTIHTTKLESNNNFLSDLSVLGFEDLIDFDKTVSVYSITIPNEVSSIVINAIPEENVSVVEGDGTQNVNTGNNMFNIQVTSESGLVRTYTLNVNRELSDENRIEYLLVNNGTLSPSFTSDNTNYDVVLPFDQNNLDLSVVLKDSSSSYEIIDNNIEGTSGTVRIKVTSESGIEKIYKLNVIKDVNSVALLKSLSVEDYEFTPDFNSNIFNYNLVVNYETTSLDLDYEPLITGSNVSVSGNSNFSIGTNEVKLQVTALDNTTTNTYTIKVTRNKDVNNYLDYLFNDYLNGDFNEPFDKLTLSYTLTVETDVDSIVLYGEKQSSDSTLTVDAKNKTNDSSLASESYLGTFGLEKGKNKIKINITNQGYTRTYIITITRKQSSEKDLLSLIVRGNNKKLILTPEFVSTTNTYSLSVDKDTNMIELVGTSSPLSTVTGLGDVYLDPGLNVIKINVIAEDGTTNTYTINVTKEASSETHLVDLVPSSGELDPPFGYENENYDLVLDSSVNFLSFEVTPEDGNSTVTGYESEIVPTGTSVRTIVVTAEDKTTTRTYTINVIKVISDDATLSSLRVKDYDFINPDDENTKVTFDSANNDYYVIIKNDKLEFNAADIIYTTNHEKAKVTYSSTITPDTKSYTEFDVVVTAEDGITKNIYKVFVKRELGSNSQIKKVEPLVGYIETIFRSDEYNYVWIYPALKTIDPTNLNPTLVDENATYELSVDGELVKAIVTSEDGTSVTTYVFNIERDLNKNAKASNIEIYYDTNELLELNPEFDSETMEYTIHIYEDEDSLRVSVTPEEDSSYAVYEDEEGNIFDVILTDEKTSSFTFNVFAEDDVTNEEYTINVIKDIKHLETASMIEVLDPNEVCTSNLCTLTPAFNSNTVAYRTSVPYEYDVLNLKTTVDEQQSVKYYIYQGDDLLEIENGVYELSLGENIIYIKIFDGLGFNTKIYRVTVTRNKSTNTDLDNLIVSSEVDGTYTLMDKDDNEITYSNSINEYYLTVSNSVEEIKVNYLKNEEEQKVKVSDFGYLTIGEVNEVSIKITAPDKKTTRTILLHVYREGEFEVYIDNITVSSGSIWELSPEFKKTITSYVVNVSSGTEIVKVEASSNDVNTTVSEAETRIINTGINEYEIFASKTDNEGIVHTKTYTVNVIRPIASEVYLSGLRVYSLIDGEYTKFKNEFGDAITFDKGTTDYYFETSPGVKSLNINATPGNSSWKVNVYGNNFATGRNIVSIIVYNEEYTTSRTYQLVVTVKPSKDASITKVTVKDDEETYGVSDEDFVLVNDKSYSVNVPYNVEKVDVSVTPNIDTSNVDGNGLYYLEYGNNVVTLTVTAEDGETTENYTVNIFREYNLYLSAINEDCDSSDINEEFLKTNVNYTMDVDNDIEEITIFAISEENNVTISYALDEGSSVDANIIDGVLYTGVGINKVLITVTAPDNTYKVYHLDITRTASDNNYLEALDFNEGNLNEPFIKTDNNYTMYVLDIYTSLSYDNKTDILTEDPNASYVVSGLSPLSKTEANTVTITVTSQSGKTNIYTVSVILKPEAWFKHYLQKLELSYTSTGSDNVQVTNYATLSPTFVKEKMSYTATVPYGVSSITVTTQTYSEDDEAIISASTESTTSVALGTYSLNLGRNVINVKVHSKLLNNDGSYAVYKVIVYRNKNPEAELQSLAVKNHLLSPSFASKVTNYYIEITTEETKLDITAVPKDPNAKVTILGNGPFSEGNNEITIRVLAADGITSKEYKINANCTLSNNNYLKSLDVKDYSITPEFVKTNTGVYLTNVDNDVTTVFLSAIKEDPSATLTITQGSNSYNKENVSLKLNPGNNYIYISVNSAAGNTRTYTLNVFRSYSTDNTLKELVISDGVLVPTFDSLEVNYTVTLEDDLALLDRVSIIGIKNDPTATVKGNKEYNLNDVGTTKVEIEVTAQSGDKRVYTVNLIKKEAPSSKLETLEVYEGELVPEFNKDGYKYYVTVPNEITSLDLELNKNVIPEDSEAIVTISGNENFKVGINVVTIKVTATNNDYKNYYIYATRSILASNYLSDLYVDDYSIEPTFDADTLYYSLTVGSNIDSIHVYGEKEDEKATLEINGSEVNDKVINLNYGINKVYFTVTSDNGASRTYTLEVTRSDSDEYYLLSLETNIGTWNKGFDKDINDYVISVPEKTSLIEFTGTYSVGATAEGLEFVTIKLGENIHNIVVTSPSGLKNTYTFKIIRPGSNNTNIISITSNHGELIIIDDVYKLPVEDSISTISFEVELEDKDAKVIMDSSYNLNYGTNLITIKVIAEDGTEKDVPIEIYRFRDIASISYDEEEIILNVGDEDTPTYTINPDNTDFKNVTFRSDDETIATVNSSGKITAVGNGITYVYVVSEHNESVYDWIKVNVASTKITSSIYDIWHTGDSENNLASVDFSYVIGANDKTQVDDFIDNFDNNREHLKVFTTDTMIDDYSKYVGTGMKIKLIINDVVYDELVVVVRGDNGTLEKPGNGIITSTDYATLSSILAGLTLKTPITSLLYDLNKNKILTVTDLSPMSLYIAGKATFTNLNGL